MRLDAKLFHVTNTLRIFENYQTREEALESNNDPKHREITLSFDSMINVHQSII